MYENNFRFHTKINNIELRMIKTRDKCWIKVIPLFRVSKPSSIHLILNNEYYHYDIYDKNGIEAHEFYFEGFECEPSFYLKSGKKIYRIDFKMEGIKIKPIKDVHKQDVYIKKYCNIKSSQSSCWAKAVYYTSRPDKSPFDEI